MGLLKFKIFTGPNDWYFVDPDTGRRFEAHNQADLCRHIREYRKQNQLEDLPYLESVVEHYLCSRPENIGACVQSKPLRRGLIQTLRGGIAIIKSIAYKDHETSTQEEADRRSEICSTCPHNSFPDKGPYIQWADDLAEAAVKNKKSSCHDKLGNCMVCSCPLRAKVWWNGEFKFRRRELAQFPDYCWQLQEALKQGAIRK